MANEQNLIPAKPGEVRNPNGKPKGTKHLSTIVRETLENEIDWKLVPVKGNQDLAEKYKNKSAWQAILYVATAQAMSGNVQAMEWLRKAGYGDKHEVNVTVNPAREVLRAAGLLEDENDGSTTEDTQGSSDKPTQV